MDLGAAERLEGGPVQGLSRFGLPGVAPPLAVTIQRAG